MFGVAEFISIDRIFVNQNVRLLLVVRVTWYLLALSTGNVLLSDDCVARALVSVDSTY